MKINKISEYKGLKLGKPVTEKPTEEEVNNAIESLIEKSSKMVEKQGKASVGDTANIDFEGFLDGVAFEGGKGEKYDLVLGSGTFIPGFEDQLVGHEKGESVDVNVTFPENYQAENLKGKAVVFKCKINEIKQKQAPKFDDELAKAYGLANASELKEALTENIYLQKTNKDLNEYLTKVWDKLAQDSDIEVDDAALEEKMDQMVSYYANSMAQYGATMDQYLQMVGQTMDQFKENIKPEAVKTAKIDAIYDYITKQEKFEITEEDIEKEIANIKEYYGLNDEDVKKLKEESLDQVKKEIGKTKVSNFLLKNND